MIQVNFILIFFQEEDNFNKKENEELIKEIERLKEEMKIVNLLIMHAD